MKLFILLIILCAVAYAVLKIRRKLDFLQSSGSPSVKSRKPTQKSTTSKSQNLSTDQLFTSLVQDEKLMFRDEQKNGYLLVIEEGNPRGKKIILIGVNIIIGRSPVNDVTIDDPMISDRHCRIDIGDNGGIHLEDLDSTNGTLLNGKRVKKSDIKPDDMIQVGKTRLRFIKDNE